MSAPKIGRLRWQSISKTEEQTMNMNYEETKFDRRRFLGTAAMSVAAAQLGIIGSARAESKKSGLVQTGETRTSASFGPLKRIDAGLLNIGYAEAGPADGRPVGLLPCRPYDLHT